MSSPKAKRPTRKRPAAKADPEGLDLTVVDLDPVAFQRWLLEQALRGMDAAGLGSIAYIQGLKEVRSARDKLDELMAQAEAAGNRDPASLTPEEWTARHEAMALEASTPDLEVYLREWLARHRYELKVEQGELRLDRLPL